MLCRIRKDGYQMQKIPREYLLLFNAITDAEESLRRRAGSLLHLPMTKAARPW